MDRYLCDVLVTMDGPAGRVPAPIADGAVDVGDDGRIVWCGPAREAPDRDSGTAVHRAGILMPGLINAHCHTPMVLLRGAGEGLPVHRWLHEVMWPRESKLTAEDVRAGMRLGAAEMLANGITTSVEMYFQGQALAEGAADAGLRCLVTPGVIEDPDFTLTGPWPDQLDEMVALRDRWAGNHLIRAGIAAHAAYSVSRECLSAIAARAAATGMPVHIHLAEQQWEDAAVRERFGGLAAPEYLESLGLLEGDVIAAHGVWLTSEDIEVLARNDTAVVHCPCSNAKHASGVAPVTEMRAAGLRVAIGTDGPASHHRLDLFEEMRTAIRTARIRSGDAQTLPPAEALRMTTAGAAEVVGWDSELGRLAPGCWADMVALSAAEPALNPVIADEDDPLSRIVWSGSPGAISGVWVAGRKVVEDGRLLTMDMAAAVSDAQTRARRLAR